MASLIDCRGVQFHLGDHVRVGREPDNDLVIADDDTVSGHHALIIRKGDKYFIRDLESKNGILLRGERVNGGLTLDDGDSIQIGRHTYTFQQVSSDILRRPVVSLPVLSNQTVGGVSSPWSVWVMELWNLTPEQKFKYLTVLAYVTRSKNTFSAEDVALFYHNFTAMNLLPDERHAFVRDFLISEHSLTPPELPRIDTQLGRFVFLAQVLRVAIGCDATAEAYVSELAMEFGFEPSLTEAIVARVKNTSFFDWLQWILDGACIYCAYDEGGFKEAVKELKERQVISDMRDKLGGPAKITRQPVEIARMLKRRWDKAADRIHDEVAGRVTGDPVSFQKAYASRLKNDLIWLQHGPRFERSSTRKRRERLKDVVESLSLISK